ncbi:hypothetical protein [Actinoallomurus sp. NPDC052274]
MTRNIIPENASPGIGDGALSENANPLDHQVYAGCFAGLTMICSGH